MRPKIMEIRNSSHAFDDMDDIIEIDRFPENPVLMRYESMDLKDQTTLSSNPIDQQGPHTGLSLVAQGSEQDYQKEKYNIEPFVSWH